MLLRSLNFSVGNLLRQSPSLWKTVARDFRAASILRQKNGKKNGGRFSKNAETDTLKITRPGNCADLTAPILDPLCKVAIVVGGANGFGFAAADHLLCRGARGVVIVDDDPVQGKSATQRLCDAHGKARAQFFYCDIRNICQFEATVNQVLLKYKKIHIVFNDLDKRRLPLQPNCKKTEPNWNNTTRAIRVGVKAIGKQNGGQGGIIINCASILGFMGWPEDPFPVYCMKEPAIETTMDLTEEYNVEKTGVRLVALCPTNKVFSELGLPDFPNTPGNRVVEKPPCMPSSNWRLGRALSHVLAWAKSGSTWIIEPTTSPREVPQLIHFSTGEGKKVDSKIYDIQPCNVAIEPRCAASKACSPDVGKNCEAKVSKRK